MFHEQAKYQKGRNLFLLSKLYRPTKPRRIPMNFNKSLLGILFIPFTMPRRHVHWHGLKWSLIGNAWDESPKAAKVNVFFFKKESAAQNMFSLDTQILHPQESNMSPNKGAISKGKDRTPTTIFSVAKSSFRKRTYFIGKIPSGAENIHLPSWWKIPKKCRHLVLCSSREVDPRWHTRSEASPWGIYSSLVTIF